MGKEINMINIIKIMVISLLIIISAALSGCITDESSKDNEKGVEETGILLPLNFNRSANYNLTYNTWVPRANFSDYGEITNYTIILAWFSYDSNSANYCEVSEIDYEVIFEDPRDEFGNLISDAYRKFEQPISSVYRYFTNERLENETIMSQSIYNEVKPNIYNLTTNPINDQKDLDFYPPRIFTTYDFTNATNTGSDGHIELKNYGAQSDVTVTVAFEYFIEKIENNMTVKELVIAEYQTVFQMDNSEVVKISAHFPPNAKIPPLVYEDYLGRRHPTSRIYDYRLSQQWEASYAKSGESSYGDMSIERY
jgi:hypothetical protein